MKTKKISAIILLFTVTMIYAKENDLTKERQFTTQQKDSVSELKNKLGTYWQGFIGKDHIDFVITKVTKDSIFARNRFGEDSWRNNRYGKRAKGVKGAYTINGDTLKLIAKEYKIKKHEDSHYRYNGTYTMNFILSKNVVDGEYIQGRNKEKFVFTNENYFKPEHIVGSWKGKFRKGANILIKINKVTKDSIFGETIMWNSKIQLKNKIKGVFARMTTDHKTKWESWLGVSMYEIDKNSNIIKKDGGAYHFRVVFMRKWIDGIYVSAEGKRTEYDLYRSVEEKFKQSKNEQKQIDKSLLQLEVLIKDMVTIYDKILYEGYYTRFETIKKAKNHYKKIEQFAKDYPNLRDNRKLNYLQEEKMKKINATIINYRQNSKLQRLLEKVN